MIFRKIQKFLEFRYQVQLPASSGSLRQKAAVAKLFKSNRLDFFSFLSLSLIHYTTQS